MNYMLMKKKALGGGWWEDPSCVGAYRFVGVSSEAEALQDMSGAGHHLTAIGSPSWDTSSGYRLSILGKYLNNSDLNNEDIKTVIVRYEDISQSGKIVNFSCFHGAGGAGEICGILDYRYFWNGAWNNGEANNYPAFITQITSSSISYRRSLDINPLSSASGVFAGSESGLWYNGEPLDSTVISRSFETLWIENGEASVGVGETASFNEVAPCNILAIAFYTAELSDLTHQIITDNMNRF